ncbi:hypothetical protein C8R48DRAFT_779192 [Suillus tomentosus]|nr:hypothetical protein C8R48DRAFT_779192 [Suillus tomentosus]
MEKGRELAFNCVSKEWATGEAGPSFSRYHLDNQSSHKLSDEDMAYLAGAGEKLQCKKNWTPSLVVTGVAPKLDDYGSLLQIEAFKFILECLRWRPVTIFVFAHRALTDISYVRFHWFGVIAD